LADPTIRVLALILMPLIIYDAWLNLSHWIEHHVPMENDNGASTSSDRRIRELNRQRARKEKPLAEAATLLVLKKWLFRKSSR